MRRMTDRGSPVARAIERYREDSLITNSLTKVG
jgi:hypothetical protein